MATIKKLIAKNEISGRENEAFGSAEIKNSATKKKDKTPSKFLIYLRNGLKTELNH